MIETSVVLVIYFSKVYRRYTQILKIESIRVCKALCGQIKYSYIYSYFELKI